MNKSYVFAFVLLFSVGLVLALGVPEFTDAVVTKSHNSVNVHIPENAVEVSPGAFFIGNSVDVDGSILEGYAIIDYKYKKENVKPNGVGGKPEKGSVCYAFLASGAKWKNQESYLINPANAAGLEEQIIRDVVRDAIIEWEVAAGKEIFGNEVSGFVDGASIGNSANGQNEVVFGSIDNPGVIAVTYVWGIFGGNPSNRRLVEWDQVYNQNDFSWSFVGEAGKMDFENIAQHELGHSFGLGHPSDGCTEETMFRYASYGETKKRDLNSGDIEGIKKLYK